LDILDNLTKANQINKKTSVCFYLFITYNT
jgi:hypothetical protein